MGKEIRENRTYGRRLGRKLRTKKQNLLNTLLPKVAVRVEEDGVHGLNPESYKACFLEIGFGTGDHLALQARENPDVLMVGCEPFVNGVANLLEMMEQESLSNIRIYPGNALVFLRAILDQSLDHIFLLFPDPWPKKGHHKRRFVRRETLSLLAQKLSPKGRLLIATDHEDYFEWICEKAFDHPDLEFLNPNPETWQTFPDTWTQTRFQKKAEDADRIPRFLWFGRQKM